MESLSYLAFKSRGREPSQAGGRLSSVAERGSGVELCKISDKCRRVAVFQDELTYSSAASATQSAALPSRTFLPTADCSPRAFGNG